jgi:hypothetical protein
MDKEVLRQEVDANYDFFQRNLAVLLPDRTPCCVAAGSKVFMHARAMRTVSA